LSTYVKPLEEEIESFVFVISDEIIVLGVILSIMIFTGIIIIKGSGKEKKPKSKKKAKSKDKIKIKKKPRAKKKIMFYSEKKQKIGLKNLLLKK